MTILPKKKQSKEKSDTETTDHSHTATHNHPHNHNHSHYHHPTASETRLEKGARGRTSPTRWIPSTSREEVPPRDPGGTFENHESSSLTSAHNKRRHRSSPHRTVRKHRGHSANVPPLSPHSPSAGPSQECEDPYNSEDEHCPPTLPEDLELERWFEKALKEKKGFLIKKMKEDGACLFRAVADQVYGDQEMHSCLRKHCIDYMRKNAEFFSHYVTEDFTTYLNRKRIDSCHGNHLEMQAMCELFNRPIEVFQYSIDPINTFHSTYKTDNEPIRISYHGSVHYNSVIDPYKATIGVGLGLPGLQPGLAEKNLMKDAKKMSENTLIEKTMLEDKIRETDWELTQETIEEQVARESYLQWLKEQERHANRQGAARSATATCSSSSEYTHTHFEPTASSESRGGRSPRLRSGPSSPQRMDGMDGSIPHVASPFIPTAGCSQSPKQSEATASLDITGAATSSSVKFQETASIMDHIPPSVLGLSDWDEDDILAQVMAQSQQEYLQTLKRNAVSSSSPAASSSNPPQPFDTAAASCSSSSSSHNKQSIDVPFHYKDPS